MWLWQLIQIMSSKFFGDNQTIKVSRLSDLSSLQSNTQFSAALWTRSSTAAMTVTGDWPIVIKFVSSVLWKLSKNDLVPHFRGFYYSDGCSSRLLHPFINLYLPSIQNTFNPKIWTSPLIFFLRPATVYLCSKFSFCSCWFSSLSVVDLERETETEIFVSYERFTCLLQLPCAFGPPSYLHWIVE